MEYFENIKNEIVDPKKTVRFHFQHAPYIRTHVIDNLKQCLYLKCSYLKMGSHGNALAVSFFRRRARFRSRAHDFNYSIEKRCGKLGRYISFNEIHARKLDEKHKKP